MRRLIEAIDYDLWLDQIERPFAFASPFEAEQFVIMIVAADASTTNDERTSLSDAIVRAGCRYAVCTGHECSRWDDAIDIAFVSTDPDYNPPDGQFVMTTWHENEPLEDVAWFFRWNTAFDYFVPRHFIVLLLGGPKQVEVEVREAVMKVFAAET